MENTFMEDSSMEESSIESSPWGSPPWGSPPWRGLPWRGRVLHGGDLRGLFHGGLLVDSSISCRTMDDHNKFVHEPVVHGKRCPRFNFRSRPTYLRPRVAIISWDSLALLPCTNTIHCLCKPSGPRLCKLLRSLWETDFLVRRPRPEGKFCG